MKNIIRPLEGYRALAIIVVLVFHLDKSLLSGGYLGVDIFFVISGFIITKGLMAAKENNSLSLGAFYRKRFRRLFPALMIVTLATLIASYFILSPEGLEDVSKSAIASIFSVANIHFWLDSGYFATEAAAKPLLHMWSLSVEEQFYLFWPVIIAAFSTRFWKHWALLLFIFSFGTTLFYGRTLPETAFFWFPFRVYEFMGGAVLSIYSLKIKNGVLANLALWAGSLIFVGACFIFNEESHIALTGIVTVIASALMLTSMQTQSANLLFGNRVGFWIGQRSYSIYLIHWPLIVLFVTSQGALRWLDMVLLGAASILLGAVLKWGIEDPFRESRSTRSITGKKAFPMLIFTGVATLAVSSVFWKFNGFPERLDQDIGPLLVKDTRMDKLMLSGTCFLDNNDLFSNLQESCYKPDPLKKNMLLIGSSVAADLRFGLEKSFSDWHISQITAARCAPLLGTHREPRCISTRDFIYESVLPAYKYDLVVMSGVQKGDETEIVRLEKYFNDRDIEHVLIGPRPTYNRPPRRIVAEHGVSNGLDDLMKTYLSIPEEQRLNNPQNYFSSIEALCDRKGNCSWRADNTMLYRDRVHLTPEGSIFLGEKFLRWTEARDKAKR